MMLFPCRGIYRVPPHNGTLTRGAQWGCAIFLKGTSGWFFPANTATARYHSRHHTLQTAFKLAVKSGVDCNIGNLAFWLFQHLLHLTAQQRVKNTGMKVDRGRFSKKQGSFSWVHEKNELSPGAVDATVDSVSGKGHKTKRPRFCLCGILSSFSHFLLPDSCFLYFLKFSENGVLGKVFN